ncbi:receptor-like cytoplasmic kinase 176 [Tanacetum coccineum]
MLHVVSRNCTIGPQVCEIAGGLPVGKTLLHLPSLTTNEVRPEGEAFDLIVYGDFSNSVFPFVVFADSPNKQCVDGEFACVDIVNQAHFKIEVLNTVLCSLGFEDDDVFNLYYKILLKSLDIGLKPLLVETTEDSSDEDGEGDSENDSEDGQVDANDIIDEEHLVDEVEVNMTAFNFQIEGQGEDGQVDPIQPLVTLTEDDLEVLDYDSFESDQEDVPENARRKEFANRDLEKERIRAYSVETRRNIDFKRNDKRRIKAVCKGVVPSITGKNVFVDKDEGPKEDISRKGKEVNEDAEEDKKCYPWVLYLTKGDKAKWVVKTYKDEHQCLQSKKIKHCTSSFLAKYITDLLTMDPGMPVKAIQEQMQKKFHVAVSNTKAFRAKAKAQVHLKGDVKVQYSLLRDYVRRELLGLDEAFIRGQYPGQMLTDMGVDANNGIYPVAYGILKSENQYSWTWFLTCLANDFNLFSNSNFTFIIDRQKGLLPTIARLFPSAEHRYCVRHINEYINLTWKGGDYKEMLWKCATSTTVVKFEKHMQELKYYNKKAYEWLNKIAPEH